LRLDKEPHVSMHAHAGAPPLETGRDKPAGGRAFS
jgi:hypothetical protein